MTRMNGSLHISPQRITFDRFRGEIGFGPIEMNGSLSVQDDESHNLNLFADQALLISRRDLRLRIDGRVNLSGFLINLI